MRQEIVDRLSGTASLVFGNNNEQDAIGPRIAAENEAHEIGATSEELSAAIDDFTETHGPFTEAQEDPNWRPTAV